MMMNKVVLASLTAVATSALFAVSTANTYARVKVTPPSSSVKSMIVAVPVTSATDGTDVKVPDLIMPFNLKKDDSILKWNGTAYDGWKWNGSSWDAYTVATADEGVVTQSETPVADTALARGTAFWFNRAGGFSNESIYLWGQYADDVQVTSQVQEGLKTKPVWTLLGNPKATDYNFTNLPDGAEGDEIWIIDNSGNAKKVVFHSSQWCTISVKSVTNDKGMTVSTVVYTPVDSSMSVKPGHGFWYMSVGGAPTFNW